LILFNAPIQMEDHTKRVVKMAVEMRDVVGLLTERWRNRGHSLGVGVGVALGYATLGQVGFEHRLEYAAIGSVTNLASRLCAEAKAGKIVVSRRVYGMVERWVDAVPMDDLKLKGFNHPVLAMEILRWREEADNVLEATAAVAARRRMWPRATSPARTEATICGQSHAIMSRFETTRHGDGWCILISIAG